MTWICPSRENFQVFFLVVSIVSCLTASYYFILLEPEGKETVATYNQPNLCVDTITPYNQSNQSANLQMKNFCRKISSSFEYFKEVCKSANPVTINYSPKPLANDQLGLTPVAVIATNRSNVLYRTLRALTSAEGVNPSLIIVFLDGEFKEPTYVSKLFNLQVQYNNIVIPKDAYKNYDKRRIDNHYKLSLDKLFALFPDAKQAIILEDDLEVSPDFFSYFNQTIGLLKEDSSLYCISAWNDFSFWHSSQDPSLLYRVDNMPGLGWMLTRNLYNEIRPKWLNESEPLAWDEWLRLPAQQKGRECIMPDVCRTFHFSTGVHITKDIQKVLFNSHSFNRQTKLHQLQTESLTKDAYEELMINLIKQASPVNHSLSFCSKSMIPDTKNQTYVIYVDGIKTQMKAMKCFKLWYVNERPGHKDSFRFWHKGNHVILIRCDDSPYCKYKPKGLPLIHSGT